MALTHREGLVMYWCEGDRSEESRTYRAALTSSDPRILKLFIEWLEQYYGTKKAQMKVRLHLWPDVDEKLAKDFWSTSLGVPLQNFTKPWTKPRGRGKAKCIHAYGICRVSIASKEIMHKILSDISREFQDY